MSAIARRRRAAGRPIFGRPAVAHLVGAALAALAAFPGPARAGDAAPAATTSAGNAAITVQAVWQVQQGCTRYCYGTSQIQAAFQTAATVQVAVAVAPPGGAASATNQAKVVQVVVQVQLGCLAYCFGSSQVQTVVQRADITQVASAVSGAVQAAADAVNDAAVDQQVWQLQQGCQEECHDTAAAQTGAPADGQPPPLPDSATFRAWVAALAGVAADAVDLVEQYDVADCLEDCHDTVDLQLGDQEDATVQVDIQLAPAPAPARDSGEPDPVAARALESPRESEAEPQQEPSPAASPPVEAEHATADPAARPSAGSPAPRRAARRPRAIRHTVARPLKCDIKPQRRARRPGSKRAARRLHRRCTNLPFIAVTMLRASNR
jgi:hypothetical protein